MIGSDAYSRFGVSKPSPEKDGESSLDVMRGFLSDVDAVGIRVNNSKELGYAVTRLKETHRVRLSLSVPYRSASNSIQERFGQEMIRCSCLAPAGRNSGAFLALGYTRVYSRV